MNEIDDMRDNFGLYGFWNSTWDIAMDTLGVMYNYQQGYYYYYLGHSLGAWVADFGIIVQWLWIYEYLQPRRADAVQRYADSYWRAYERDLNGGEDPAEGEEAAEEEDVAAPEEEDAFFI